MPRSPGPPTVRLRRLAAELRAFRADAQLTREQVEEQTGVNQGTLWRLETGRAKPHTGTLETLFDLYDVPQRRRTALVDLASSARYPGWLLQSVEYADELSDGYATYIGFESEAKAMHNFETIVIPGLLQTEEYARATMVDALPMDEAAIERRVRVRMQRQTILTRQREGADPLQLWAVVDEAALHRVVGGPAVRRAQLGKLLELNDRPNVDLQVIPFANGAHPAMTGSFVRLIFGGGASDVVYEERLAGDHFLELEAEIDRYGQAFDQLRARALGPRDSSSLIAELIAR
ncbi:XRE family transcriptional regulator [Kribbella antibiotica]|uniref:XRE family transcriptional regulator n=1 Tax=Kribbella antibiotica TaxID=190195 RepID=A0A4V2YLC8_9ACTN|nr:helix-turn-helix transcriptional regulator [Kribbella antibiotica]TDD46237.1 XRE family transcriptional regulator [Kribbella antibiotica]